MKTDGKAFWKNRTLEQLTREEWEQICDGCGRCCLEKLEDQDTGQVYYTSVACEYLDTWTCRCREYENRTQNIPDCLVIHPRNIRKFSWLPKTCAYRMLLEGQPLEDWHPIVSGDRETVHHAGISVREKVISAAYVHPDDLEAYIIDTDL